MAAMHPRRSISSLRLQWREGGRIHRRRAVLLFPVMVPMVLGGSLLHLVAHVPFWISPLLSGGWIVPAFIVTSLSERTIRRTVHEYQGSVCWQCWYPLADAESCRCPECGSHFDPPALREKWRLVLWLGGEFVQRVLLLLLVGGMVICALWLSAAIFLGLGPNLGLPFGYYGKLNRVVSRLESIPGVKVVGVAMNRDVHLEDFLVDVSIDGVRRDSIEFPDADAPVLLRMVEDWRAKEIPARAAE